MEPDSQKIAAVQEWEAPKDVTDLRSFLGVASYYRCYIRNFADIAAPLHHLTGKGVPFVWDAECQSAFDLLKTRLTKAPVLRCPDFSDSAATFQLQTDASAVGLGVILEQDGHVIAYASRTLTQAERNYSVIQKGCLALVYGMKQFCHFTSLVATSKFSRTMLHYSGCQLRKWGVYWPGGPLQSRNMTSPLCTGRVASMGMQMPCHGELRLSLVLFAYRTAEHASTGLSPFQLVFG